MMTLRQGEQGPTPTRSDRFFQKDDYWYYTTREGVDIGPFDTREEARTGCCDFVEFIVMDDPGFSTTLEQYGRRVA